MRRGPSVVLILLLFAIVLGTLAQYIGRSATPIAPPANVPAAQTVWFGPSFQTLLNTVSHPFYLVTAIITITVILMVFRWKRIAIIWVAVWAAVLSIIWFHPDPICDPQDHRCVAAQQKAADAKAAEEARKQAQAEAERQRQIAQAKLAAEKAAADAAGGPQCLDVAHNGRQFGTEPDESSIINPGGRCFIANFLQPEDEGICYYVQAANSTRRHGPFGKDCPGALPINPDTAPRDVERIWGNKPFKANYVLRPRSGVNHGTTK